MRSTSQQSGPRKTGLWFALLLAGALGACTTSAEAQSAAAGESALLDRGLQALGATEEIVFVLRGECRDLWHWYANFGYEIAPELTPAKKGDEWRWGGHGGPLFGDVWKYGGRGGRLCRFNLRTRQLTVLLDDPKGDIRDPQVHYDAQKILFSYRKGGTHQFHLYEIGVDGAGLRQLTHGPYDDIEPTYLPDGDIIFISSRCKRYVPCWRTHVAMLYRCDADGEAVRPLSSNVEHDNTPWLLPDGRVLYTRWEYVDRCDMTFHHLWTMNPDGTGQMVYFGNMHPGYVMIDAKPIPGTDRVLSVFSSEHGSPEHRGAVAIVDPHAGPDRHESARFLTKSIRSMKTGYRDPYPHSGPDLHESARSLTKPIRSMKTGYRDPYPLRADVFLVAEDLYEDEGKDKGRQKTSRLLLMDDRGGWTEIFRAAEKDLLVHEPRPLRPRPREPVILPRSDLGKSTGRLILTDVNHGRSMAGVKPGEIKKLLVLEQLAKPWNGNPWPDMITFGSHLWGDGGAYTLTRIVGTVPVEPDGSAYVEVPALRSLFFVALDENDLSVKRMQSFLTVMPGETTGCVGCHENRTETALPDRDLAALRHPPRQIEPIADVPEIFDFLRDVQPILDKHCVCCHDGKHDSEEARAVDLTTRKVVGRKFGQGRGGIYAQSYLTLVLKRNDDPQSAFVSHAYNMGGNRPPRSIGSSASLLMKLIDGSHYDAKLSAHEQKMIRLWIDTSAVYAGTYAALGGMEGPYHVPEFRPNEHYVREMKRYGILPADFDLANDPINVYEVDQAYWRSFWHQARNAVGPSTPVRNSNE